VVKGKKGGRERCGGETQRDFSQPAAARVAASSQPTIWYRHGDGRKAIMWMDGRISGNRKYFYTYKFINMYTRVESGKEGKRVTLLVGWLVFDSRWRAKEWREWGVGKGRWFHLLLWESRMPPSRMIAEWQYFAACLSWLLGPGEDGVNI
jgi:hypothetical protein